MLHALQHTTVQNVLQVLQLMYVYSIRGGYKGILWITVLSQVDEFLSFATTKWHINYREDEHGHLLKK